MNRDFAEMLKALAAESVEFLVVGAYAVAGHGIPRATGDIDLWVRSTPANAARRLPVVKLSSGHASKGTQALLSSSTDFPPAG